MRNGIRRSTRPAQAGGYFNPKETVWTPERSAALSLMAQITQWKFPTALISWSVEIPQGIDRKQLAEETRRAFDAAFDEQDPRPHQPPPLTYWFELLGCEVTATLSREMHEEAKSKLKFMDAMHGTTLR